MPFGQKPKNIARRKRKPRDLAASIITDRLEKIEARAKRGPLTSDETDFVLVAYKALAEAEHTDAEVSLLESLSPAESNQLEDMLAEIIDVEPEAKAS